jgi:hypothetical protein
VPVLDLRAKQKDKDRQCSPKTPVNFFNRLPASNKFRAGSTSLPRAFPGIIFLPALALGYSECVVKRIELEYHQATSAIEQPSSSSRVSTKAAEGFLKMHQTTPPTPLPPG